MIQVLSRLNVADNTGAKEVGVIKVYGGTRRRYAGVGDVVLVSVKKLSSFSGVKKGEMFKALIVRTKSKVRRKSGATLSFDENSCVLLKNDGSILGTRVFGPLSRELKEKGYNKLISIAEFVF
ncbi:50S ribosomal protein L14 [Candidatus Mycoplasma haematominutum]|uniref:Large ribosomal subunit protein uL14 n=1 Tax=Candidatus Mycoplasma haematominutum 'Birmingham 1' TaxID=1116213 RepID=G8C325_9MOLU|nr:50S ribosomal protein L14 [Candidatus Mycoplasma haematominutum]CCE66723.1 ribosomal protein L14 [Candidatus Mycoplasma haematominutum 'Birmingham 1']